MTVKVLGVDLDGTILDCRTRQVALASSLAGRHGYKLDESSFWDSKRNGESTLMALRKQLVNDHDAKIINAEWVENIEKDEWLELDLVIPGAEDSLRAFDNVDFVLITSRHRPEGVMSTLERLGIESLFYGIHVVGAGKKAVEGKARILKRIRASCMVGDTEVDFMAAKLAGVSFAGVSTGQRSSEFLKNKGIEQVHDSLEAAIQSVI